MACFGAVSFQDGNGSAPLTVVRKLSAHASAARGVDVIGAKRAARRDECGPVIFDLVVRFSGRSRWLRLRKGARC